MSVVLCLFVTQPPFQRGSNVYHDDTHADHRRLQVRHQRLRPSDALPYAAGQVLVETTELNCQESHTYEMMAN